MRDAFSDFIVEAAVRDPAVLLLTGDHGYALFDAFRRERPDQYINCGIAEQNMVGVAAGLAKAGFRPIVYGLAAFVPIRVLEQIKMDICYENLPVMLVGDGAGVVYAQLGSSHQSTEDIAAVRALPDISVYSPADRYELTACMHRMLDAKGPSYIRMGKADLGDVHRAALDPTALDRVLTLSDGGGALTILATGSMVSKAVRLAAGWVGSTVVSVPSVKPLDPEGILRSVQGKSVVVVLEEHSVVGGLGSAVAEVLVGRFAGRVLRLGIDDRFSPLCGTYDYVMDEHGLSIEKLRETLADILGTPAGAAL